jgi:DNA-binding GntR family transcriptional regulator
VSYLDSVRWRGRENALGYEDHGRGASMKAVSTNRESLNDRVYESIRDAIILGELAPGSLHSVYELAKILEVSRTPVREALVRLADQGMVRIERNRGARILQTSAHDLEEIYSIRLMLEVPATFRATQLITAGEVRRLRQALRLSA